MNGDRPEHAPFGACGCAACADAWTPPRRAFLGLSAAMGAAWLAAPWSARAQPALGPDAALARLMAGNARFARGDNNEMHSFKVDLPALRAGTVAKQSPFAAVLGCADSRVPVELVFDESIGSIFVSRVAGNVANTETIASLEYGADHLEIPLILVLAHQNCGAIDAAIKKLAAPGQITALYAPLQAAVARGGGDQAATAKLNAKIQADILATASTVLAERIHEGKLKIAAGYYELGSGVVQLV